MKYFTSIWTCIVLALVLVGIRIEDPLLVEQLRLNSFDQYIRSIPDSEAKGVTLINIGEESLAELGQYPFPRQTYAQIISDLRDANAGVIGFTFLFPEEDRFQGDEVFASWIKNNWVVLAQDARSNGRSTTAPFVGTATKGFGDPYDFAYKYKGLVTNIWKLESQAAGVGLVNGSQEVDNITRRLPLISQVNNQLYPSFPLEILRVKEMSKSYAMHVEEDGIRDIFIPPYTPIKTEYNGSIWLNTNYTFEEHTYGVGKLPDLRAKTVIIGLTASGLSSQLATPQGLFYPHQVQASALQTLLDGVSITRPVWADIAEIFIILFGSILIIFAIYKFSAVTSLSIIIPIILSVGYTAYYLWVDAKVLLDVSYPLLTYVLIFCSASFNNFYIQFKLRQQVRKQFETYLDPRQVALLQKNPEMLKLGGDRREMSFLFMDIVGFTPISEFYKNKDDPEGLVELVNEFLDAMSQIILSNGGTIDKYMGDCIMAFWNAPLPCTNHADMAVKSAIEIEEKTNELKDLYKARGLPDINVGTGVNTGDCIVGNMGSKSRFDYSVIGDAVNLAARLEATAARHEYLDYKTIVSSYTVEQLSPEYDVTEIGNIKVKGKEELIKIYSPR
jgi:adenylate cyclase